MGEDVKHRRTLLNGLSLYFLQVVRLVLPLATVPYVTRVLGASGYGEFAAGLSIATYFTVVVTYGFDLTGVRAVSLARGDDERGRVVAEIVVAKLLLGVVSLLITFALALSGALPDGVSQVLLVLSVMIVSAGLHQAWLFQGIESSEFVLIANVIGYGISVFLIFTLVRTEEDVLVYAACYAVAGLVGAVLSVLFSGARLRLRLVVPAVSEVFGRLRVGFPIFLTSLFSAVMAGFGLTYMTLVGVHAEELGLYAGVSKLALLLSATYAPLNQAWFPRGSQRFAMGFGVGLRSAWRFIGVSGFVWACLGGLVCLAGPQLLPFLFGAEFGGSEVLLYPMVIWVVVSVVNNGLGVQILVSSGHSREYAAVFLVGVAAVVVLTPILVLSGGVQGAAWAAAGAEVVLCAGNAWQVLRIARGRTLESGWRHA